MVNSPIQDQMEQLMAEFAQQQSRLLGVRQQLERASVSETSKDHLVTVTVGVSGEVRGIVFHGTDYATMAPAELATTLVGLLNTAREKAGRRARDAFRPLSRFGADVRDSIAGSPELDDLFAPLREALGAAEGRAATGEDHDG